MVVMDPGRFFVPLPELEGLKIVCIEMKRGISITHKLVQLLLIWGLGGSNCNGDVVSNGILIILC